MKNQYFGDKRDLFKFDLVLDVMAATGLAALTYVPMLTLPDDRNHGRLTPRALGGRRTALFDFLRSVREEGRADIRELRSFFGQLSGFRYLPYRDGLDVGQYAPESRDEYFAEIPDDLLVGSCVLLDPDIGLEGDAAVMKRSGLDKYLYLDSLCDLFLRSADGVVLVYQHLQNNAHLRLGQIARDIKTISRRLKLKSVPFIRDGDVAFYLVSKDPWLAQKGAVAFSTQADKTGRLREHATEVLRVALSLLGKVEVSDLALFGSVARSEHTAASDVDVLVRFHNPATLRGYFSVQTMLESMLGREVDLVTDKALRPELRSYVERDAIHAA